MSNLPKCKTCNGAKVTRHKGKDWSAHPYGCATCDGTGLDLPTIRAARARIAELEAKMNERDHLLKEIEAFLCFKGEPTRTDTEGIKRDIRKLLKVDAAGQPLPAAPKDAASDQPAQENER